MGAAGVFQGPGMVEEVDSLEFYRFPSLALRGIHIPINLLFHPQEIHNKNHSNKNDKLSLCLSSNSQSQNEIL